MVYYPLSLATIRYWSNEFRKEIPTIQMRLKLESATQDLALGTGFAY